MVPAYNIKVNITPLAGAEDYNISYYQGVLLYCPANSKNKS